MTEPKLTSGRSHSLFQESFTFDKLKAAIERKEPKPKFTPPGQEFDHLEFLKTQKTEAVDIDESA